MIIKAKWLVPVTSEAIRDAAVFIQKGKIADFGAANHILAKYPNQESFNFNQGIILPGFVNAHTHLELSLFESKLTKGNFETWLFELVSKIMTVSESRWLASCKKGIKQLIKSGTTTVGDIVSTGFSIDALISSGLRGKAYIEAITPAGHFDLGTYASSLSHFQKKVKGSLVKIGVSPHSIYTVDQKVLRQLSLLARKLNLNLCMHLAESKAEVEFIKRAKGPILDLFKNRFRLPIEIKPATPSPVVYLKQMRMLNTNFTAVHAVQVNKTDLDILKESRSKVILCPLSNNNLGVGLPPISLYHRVFPDFALGTDSLASNTSLNIVEEAAFLMKKFPELDPELLLKSLTINGAKALGFEQKIGSIEKGKEADIITISAKEFKTNADLYKYIVKGEWSLLGSWVAGRKVELAN